MEYNNEKYKISLIKELNFFRSVLTFLFFTFLLNSYLPAQMQKIYRNMSDVADLYGNSVSISGDYAIIQGTISSDIIYNFATIDLLKRKKDKWIIETIVDRESYMNGFIWGNWGAYLNKNKLFYFKTQYYGLDYTHNLMIYDVISKQKDSIITQRNEFIESYGYNGTWLVVRKSSIEYKAGTPEYYIVEFFYKYIDSKFVLCDSIRFKDKNNSGINTSRIVISDKFASVGYFRDDDSGTEIGTVNVYKRDSNKWTLFQKLYQPDVDNQKQLNFGIATAISENERFLVIGYSLANDKKGKVYIYELHGDKYELYQTINEPAEKSKGQFGNAICLKNNILLLGHSQTLDNTYRGKVYYYTFKDNLWQLKFFIKPPESDKKYEAFGISVDQSGEWVIAGADYDATIHFGAGAAYIFRIPARDTVTTSICRGEGFKVGDTTYYESGTYRDTLIASYGVDSVVVLNLTVLPVSKSKIDTLLCEGDSLKVGDKHLNETGNYEIKLKNTFGCDSTVSVKLRMIERDYHLPDTTLCYGKTLTIGNQNITESGIYNIALKNINACDSIIHIKVDFIPPDIVVKDTTVCSGETLIINGEDIKESGSYDFPLINKYGCDSTVTYNVKFNSSDEIKIDTSICEGSTVKVGDQSFTQSGKYLINLQNISGCDSLIELSLKMLTLSRKELDTILCPDQSIKIGNQEISGSGHYQITLQNSSGCDSIIDLTVRHTELDTSVSILSDIGCSSGVIELTAESNAPPLHYLWSNGSTELSNTGLLKGQYELRITDNAGCKFILQFDIPERKAYYIPEVFTPDDHNNELNRTFRIFTTDPEDIEPRVKVQSIKIFNRWGETVYSSESNSFWDGTFRKSPAPAGVYLYSIAIESPCGIENVKGQVLLLR